ncbi:MAG: peroxiredoxin [Actinobacteria bacterium]|nr:peroxiredoxin [Actinomycetota bacterium]
MEPGDTVPDFTATLDDGTTTTLTELLAGGPVVLFFYPKAFTPGCTAEACHFRDLATEFEELGAQRFGISRDDPATQQRFRDEHALDYPLIADQDGSVAKLFGAKRLGPLWSKRQTFVIDTDRRLLHAMSSESDMEAHADEALEVLRESRVG